MPMGKQTALLASVSRGVEKGWEPHLSWGTSLITKVRLIYYYYYKYWSNKGLLKVRRTATSPSRGSAGFTLYIIVTVIFLRKGLFLHFPHPESHVREHEPGGPQVKHLFQSCISSCVWLRRGDLLRAVQPSYSEDRGAEAGEEAGRQPDVPERRFARVQHCGPGHEACSLLSYWRGACEQGESFKMGFY